MKNLDYLDLERFVSATDVSPSLGKALIKAVNLEKSGAAPIEFEKLINGLVDEVDGNAN